MKPILSFLLLLLFFGLVADASAQQREWRLLKRFLAPGVEVQEQTETHLKVYSPEIGASIYVAINEDETADIYGKKEVRRGGNPYQVWFASFKFWNEEREEVPRSTWSRFFRTEFLTLLRSPETNGAK